MIHQFANESGRPIRIYDIEAVPGGISPATGQRIRNHQPKESSEAPTQADEIAMATPADKAERRRKRIAEAAARENQRIRYSRTRVNELLPSIVFHDDNAAMVIICKSGANPSLRHLGRVHGIGLNFIHQEIHKPYAALGFISSKEMCADIHTKAFPTARAEEWKAVRKTSTSYHYQKINTSSDGQDTVS